MSRSFTHSFSHLASVQYLCVRGCANTEGEERKSTQSQTPVVFSEHLFVFFLCVSSPQFLTCSPHSYPSIIFPMTMDPSFLLPAHLQYSPISFLLFSLRFFFKGHPTLTDSPPSHAFHLSVLKFGFSPHHPTEFFLPS